MLYGIEGILNGKLFGGSSGGGESGGGGDSVTKGVLTISADATIDPQEFVDGNLRLVVDGTTVTKAVGIIAGTPISFCVWRGENSRFYRLTNAWAQEPYAISAGEYTAIISYTG